MESQSDWGNRTEFLANGPIFGGTVVGLRKTSKKSVPNKIDDDCFAGDRPKADIRLPAWTSNYEDTWTAASDLHLQWTAKYDSPRIYQQHHYNNNNKRMTGDRCMRWRAISYLVRRSYSLIIFLWLILWWLFMNELFIDMYVYISSISLCKVYLLPLVGIFIVHN